MWSSLSTIEYNDNIYVYNYLFIYFLTDSIAYERVTSALTKKSLNKTAANSSPDGQTSCPEGYHSVVNHFAPKMLAYSYNGMLRR